MPESHEFYTVFLREFPWAPAFQSIYTPYYSHNEWTRIDMRSREKLPVRVLITDDEYLKESSSFDCSVDDAIHVKLPAKWIYDRMGLKLSAQDGTFTDESGHVTVLDPSVSEDGPAALLVDKRKLVEFLRKYDCNIIWTVVGEKGLIGGRIGGGGYWPGRLEISGSFRLDRHYRLTGSVGSKATGPEQSITA